MATSSILLPPGGQRILFVLAHPDDAEFHSGGTIALLAEEGCDIHYLLVTRGDKGSNDPGMTPERLAIIREQEQRNAIRCLGVQTITFLEGYNDGEVELTLALRREIAYVVRQWRPDVVFTFDPWHRHANEVHPDHRIVGASTLDALASARSPMYYPEQLQNGITAHNPRQIYFFATSQPNHWVDISSVEEKKIAAARCHETQVKNMPANGEEWIRLRGSQSGAEHRFRLAEAFRHYVM